MPEPKAGPTLMERVERTVPRGTSWLRVARRIVEGQTSHLVLICEAARSAEKIQKVLDDLPLAEFFPNRIPCHEDVAGIWFGHVLLHDAQERTVVVVWVFPNENMCEIFPKHMFQDEWRRQRD